VKEHLVPRQTTLQGGHSGVLHSLVY
jgi:hypothetical protein